MTAPLDTASHVLVLGGTGEAAALVRAALARFGDGVRVTTALAGGTRLSGSVPGDIRIGRFGGAAGLAGYLGRHRIDRVVDASHPFAVHISAAARLACDAAGVPRLQLHQPPWRRHPLDRWIEVDDSAAAARIVGRIGRRAWLAVPPAEIDGFAAANDVRYLVRLPRAPRDRLPLRYYEIVLGQAPFALATERHLLQRHAIEVVVCVAHGGADGEARLVAARELSLPVIMVHGPAAEPGLAVEAIEAVLDWLAAPLSRPAFGKVS